jgi:pyruvate,orthophosphate dikinase
LGAPALVEFIVDGGHLRVVRAERIRLRGAALLHGVAGRHRRGEVTAAQAVNIIGPDDLARALVGYVGIAGLDVAVRGLGVSPGVASGVLVFGAAAAVAAHAAGERPVLVLPESRPDDLPGLLASEAVVTERGGQTAHAAVVARGLGRPAVAALLDGSVDPLAGRLCLASGEVLESGAVVTVDGHAGIVYRGGPAGEPSAAAQPDAGVLGWLDSVVTGLPGLAVRANADTAAAATRGRELGATGVGLCRVEHLFLGERCAVLQRVLMARPGPDLDEGLADVYTALRAEIADLLLAMDGLPVTIRLLDPPRHEFLPDLTATAVAAASAPNAADSDTLAILRRLHEHNPMLGVRGVRLGIVAPQLTVVQVQALVDAVVALRRAGADPRPELLVPMVSTPTELDVVRGLVADVCARAGTSAAELRLHLGVMIETPRAALLAAQLATRVDAMSIGTNDLTALVWGLSRDDAERHLLPAYRDLGVVARSPFEELDVDGVGLVIRRVVRDARRARAGIRIGVCGEQAAEASAVRFLTRVGVDYVSCAVPQVPLARLAAARAATAGDRVEREDVAAR